MGADAAAQARLKPRLVHDTFWDRLDTAPAGRPFPDGMRRADLAHAHLVAHPGGGGPRDRRGLPGRTRLLERRRARPPAERGPRRGPARRGSGGRGGGRRLPRPRGRDAPPPRPHAPPRVRDPPEPARRGDEDARRRVEGRGWATFEETWAGAVAAQFVRETRFDPRHAGSSEQALHDALPGWLGELCLRQAVPVELRAGGRPHTIELHAGLAGGCRGRALPRARGAGERARGRRARPPPSSSRTGWRACRGSPTACARSAGLTVVELHSSAAVSGALQHRERLRHAGRRPALRDAAPVGSGRRAGPARRSPSRRALRLRRARTPPTCSWTGPRT